ncbi:MAG: ABC transporter ATP-binding protein [Acidobacteria bacterium]|nr:MAG: ABC transporter ATP-binding protein [Acidobacteriota bacterium]REK02436.1 MAG: ABC transporter ATP-binding protein [Acidobacteriota bacterium]REK13763.1 MAG: ABC transporter ATP-binding protein [Acidobacteriota bacterium]REK41757.1 MAG: ABC transporter ATP-binding protein [Acidobacteriota bacterium]
MLEVLNISAGYGDRSVLKDVSFGVPDRSITALIGANGAGKTTLIKVLNSSLSPDSGAVTLKGSPLSTLSRRQIARRVAVVAQENETRFPISVLEFVLAGRFAHGSAFGWESSEDITAAETALEICELSEMSGRLMNELSGGERQRVILARALATEADLLLLDEPTANLDLSHQAMMFRLVSERTKGCGGSAVVITHDLNLASEFADQILILNKGEVAACGRPEAVLTEDLIRSVFHVDVILDKNPRTGNVRVTTMYAE